MSTDRIDKIILIGALCALIFFVYLFVNDDGISMSRARGPKFGTIKSFDTGVKHKFGASMTWQNTQKDETVYDRDSLFTGENSRAVIATTDGSSLVLYPNSLVTVRRMTKNLEITVAKGSLMAKTERGERITVRLGGKTKHIVGTGEVMKISAQESDIQITSVSNLVTSSMAGHSKLTELVKPGSTSTSSFAQEPDAHKLEVPETDTLKPALEPALRTPAFSSPEDQLSYDLLKGAPEALPEEDGGPDSSSSNINREKPEEEMPFDGRETPEPTPPPAAESILNEDTPEPEATPGAKAAQPAPKQAPVPKFESPPEESIKPPPAPETSPTPPPEETPGAAPSPSPTASPPPAQAEMNLSPFLTWPRGSLELGSFAGIAGFQSSGGGLSLNNSQLHESESWYAKAEFRLTPRVLAEGHYEELRGHVNDTSGTVRDHSYKTSWLGGSARYRFYGDSGKGIGIYAGAGYERVSEYRFVYSGSTIFNEPIAFDSMKLSLGVEYRSYFQLRARSEISYSQAIGIAPDNNDLPGAAIDLRDRGRLTFDVSVSHVISGKIYGGVGFRYTSHRYDYTSTTSGSATPWSVTNNQVLTRIFVGIEL